MRFICRQTCLKFVLSVVIYTLRLSDSLVSTISVICEVFYNTRNWILELYLKLFDIE